ncbi:MAG: chemotaxis protein CheW [Thermodesulfovibrionales bacterium]
MTNDEDTAAAALPPEMDLLVFTAGGLKMAVDTGGVDCIMGPEEAQQLGVSFCTLNEILEPGKEDSPAARTVLLYRVGDEDRGLGVDGLDEIMTVPIGAIQPLPWPLSNFAGPRLFWGIVQRGSDLVLLIDLYRLNILKSCNAVTTA